MKMLGQIGLSMAILLGLFALYMGAYWFVNKSDTGVAFFGTEGSWYQELPLWVHRTETKFFTPAVSLERWVAKSRTQPRLPGAWTSESGKERVVIDHEMMVTPWGFTSEGLPDGIAAQGAWEYWGTLSAHLVIKPEGARTSLQISLADSDESESRLTVSSDSHDGVVLLTRVKAAAP